MKRYLLFLTLLSPVPAFCQTSGPLNPASGETVPSSACLACPGEIWNSETNIFQLDNNSASVSLQPFGNCFQSTCYYSRFLYASNFGFNIPGNATITGITADIHRQSGNINSTTDSTVRLGQNGLPVGTNMAMGIPWPLTAAYYTYGSPTDLWGAAWTPADINSAAFGLYLKVYNISITNTTPTVNHIRITVDYTTTTGAHESQTSEVSSFQVYVSEQEVQVGFILATAMAGASVGIYDQLGQLKMSKTAEWSGEGVGRVSFSRKALPSGIYFVRFEGAGTLFTKKFIIQN